MTPDERAFNLFNFHPPIAVPDPFPSGSSTSGRVTVTAVDVENGTITVDSMQPIDNVCRAAMSDYLMQVFDDRCDSRAWTPKREARRVRMARKRRRGF